MVQTWVLWIPVIAAAVGAAASIASAIVTNWMQAKRERDARRLAELDAAEMALKEIGQEVIEQVLAPGWWPNFRLLRPSREFAYDVARLVRDEEAVGAWADAWQDAGKANMSLWRIWLWNLWRFGADQRGQLIDRLLAAEIRVLVAADQMRPGGKKRRRHVEQPPEVARGPATRSRPS